VGRAGCHQYAVSPFLGRTAIYQNREANVEGRVRRYRRLVAAATVHFRDKKIAIALRRATLVVTTQSAKPCIMGLPCHSIKSHTLRTNRRITAAGDVYPFPRCKPLKTVRWPNLAEKIGRKELARDHREYTVVTTRGEAIRGGKIFIDSTGLKFSDYGPTIPSGDVAEIRIRYSKPFSDAFLEPACVLSGKGRALDTPFMVPMIAVLAGVTLASAPFVRVIEGVKHLHLDRVIKIAPLRSLPDESGKLAVFAHLIDWEKPGCGITTIHARRQGARGQ